MGRVGDKSYSSAPVASAWAKTGYFKNYGALIVLH